MRKLKLSLRIIYQAVRAFLGTRFSEGWKKRRGRLREFCDVFIISLFLWQTLKGLSYREFLAEARREFGISPSLSVYHYRLKKIDPEVLQRITREIGRKIFQRKGGKIKLIFDGTGLSFNEMEYFYN